MREWEINLRHLRGTPTPEGYELVEWQGTDPHLLYSDGFLVREISPEPERCQFCGFPNPKTDDRAGSVVMTCCNQKISTCCPGASDGQSG